MPDWDMFAKEFDGSREGTRWLGKDLDLNRLKLVFSVEDWGSKVRVISGQRFYKRKRV